MEAAFNTGAVDNIVEAVLYTGIVEPDGTVTFIGEDQGLYAGTQAMAANDLTRLVLDDGQSEAVAYQDVSFSEDLTLFTLEVPLAYYAPGVTAGSEDYLDITLRMTYEATTEAFTQGFYATNEFGTTSEFTTDPGAAIKDITPQEDGSYLIDCGISVRDLVRRICVLSGVSFEKATRAVGERPGQDAAYVIDSSKARAAFGWAPRVGLDEGLAGVRDWIDANWAAVEREPHEYRHQP